MVVTNQFTAKSKAYRLTTKPAIPSYFEKLVKELKLVTPKDTVNVDFSTFAGFEVLTFAKQTHLGRALPLSIALIKHPIQDPDSQTLFIMRTIRDFARLLGFCPHLVFDRGFESPYLVPFLVKGRVSFTLRMRQDKHVSYLGREIPLRHLPWWANDCMVTVYKHQLRVVRSEQKPRTKEPWYVLTNDCTSTRDQIIARYYFRFEIEETFKDLKHINQLKHPYPLKKPLTLTILLWFSILTMWLAFLVEDMQTYLMQRIKQKKRDRLCLTRYFFEQIQQVKAILFQEVYAM